MVFKPFHVTAANVVYSILGGFTVFFGMFSLLIRSKLYIGEAIWAFLFGIAMGPYGADIFSPRDWGKDDTVTHAITLEVTRVVLAVGVFAIGVELPSKYMKKHALSLVFLLAPVMAIGWAICAALIYALIPKLEFVPCLAIAACLTPTDPILAAAVVGGRYAEKHVPEHLRHLLSAESGCNDGTAYPFLFIALYLILEADDRVAVAKWFYVTWVYEIILGVTFGTLIGYGFRHLMKFCEDRDFIDRKSYVAQYISLALFSNGVTTLLGSDDLLAAFCAGTAFAWDSHFNKQTADSAFSSVIDLIFNIAVFVYIGAWMPFDQFSSDVTSIQVWRLAVLALLVLLIRRLPIMLALYKWMPDIKTLREGLFAGWFGPMGVGAIFIATLALEKLPHPHNPPQNQTDMLALTIEPIIAFMVMVSILTHGLSIPFFTLGRRVRSITVSRTFSMRGQPEPDWARHTPKVVRPEDIVINRDNVPPSSNQEKEIEEGRAPMSTDGLAREEEKQLDARLSREHQDVKKWRQGHHLIIEHHNPYPGSEVHVEVIRNAFKGDTLDHGMLTAEGLRHTFTTAPHKIKEDVRNYLSSFTPRTSTDGRDAPVLLLSPSVGLDAAGSKANDEDEEWEDEDQSTGSEVLEGKKPAHPTRSATQRSRPGRHRESVRRTPMIRSPPLVHLSSSSSPSPNSSLKERRPVDRHVSNSSSTAGLRNRFERVKAQGSEPATRDSSPARVLRFVEPPGATTESGTAEAKTPT